MSPRTKSSRSSSRARTRSSSSSKTTTNHDEIKKWAEDRNGKPATVQSTARGSQQAGIIRIDFPGYSGNKSLKQISWDQFFKKFDDSDLAFVYQSKTKSGKKSNFNRLIKREKAK
jgi:hypothetical protein